MVPTVITGEAGRSPSARADLYGADLSVCVVTERTDRKAPIARDGGVYLSVSGINMGCNSVCVKINQQKHTIMHRN